MLDKQVVGYLVDLVETDFEVKKDQYRDGLLEEDEYREGLKEIVKALNDLKVTPLDVSFNGAQELIQLGWSKEEGSK